MKINFSKIAALLFAGVICLAPGCTDYQSDINDIYAKIDKLADKESVSTLQQQVNGLEATLNTLVETSKTHATKAELQAAVSTLENADKAIGQRIDDLNTALSNRISELNSTLSNRIDGVAGDLSTLRGEFNTLANEFAGFKGTVTQTLKNLGDADVALGQRIDGLDEKLETKAKALGERIDGVVADLRTEASNRDAADKILGEKIDEAVSKAEKDLAAAKEELYAKLGTEAKTRKTADSLLQVAVDAEAAARVAADDALDLAIKAEKERAEGAEKLLNNAIVAEAAARAAADSVIRVLADNETAARKLADSLLNEAIMAEKERAENAEDLLDKAVKAEAIARATADSLIRVELGDVKTELDNLSADYFTFKAKTNKTLQAYGERLDGHDAAIKEINEVQIPKINAQIRALKEADSLLNVGLAQEAAARVAADAELQAGIDEVADSLSAFKAATNATIAVMQDAIDAIVAVNKQQSDSLKEAFKKFDDYVLKTTFETYQAEVQKKLDAKVDTAVFNALKADFEAYKLEVQEKLDAKADTAELNRVYKELDLRLLPLEAYKTKLEEEIIPELQAIDKELRHDVDSLCDEVDGLKARMDAAEDEIAKIKDSLAAHQLRIASLEGRMTAAEGRLDVLEEQVNELLNRIQSVEFVPDYDDCKATINYLQIGRRYYPATSTFTYKVYPAEIAERLATAMEKALTSDEEGLAEVYFDVVPVKTRFPLRDEEASIDLQIDSVAVSDRTKGAITFYVKAVNADDFYIPEEKIAGYSTASGFPVVTPGTWAGWMNQFASAWPDYDYMNGPGFPVLPGGPLVPVVLEPGDGYIIGRAEADEPETEFPKGQGSVDTGITGATLGRMFDIPLNTPGIALPFYLEEMLAEDLDVYEEEEDAVHQDYASCLVIEKNFEGNVITSEYNVWAQNPTVAVPGGFARRQTEGQYDPEGPYHYVVATEDWIEYTSDKKSVLAEGIVPAFTVNGQIMTVEDLAKLTGVNLPVSFACTTAVFDNNAEDALSIFGHAIAPATDEQKAPYVIVPAGYGLPDIEALIDKLSEEDPQIAVEDILGNAADEITYVNVNLEGEPAARKAAVGTYTAAIYAAYVGGYLMLAYGDVHIVKVQAYAKGTAEIVWTYSKDVATDAALWADADADAVYEREYDEDLVPVKVGENNLEEKAVTLDELTDATIDIDELKIFTMPDSTEVDYDVVSGNVFFRNEDDSLQVDLSGFAWDTTYLVHVVYETETATVTGDWYVKTIDRNREKLVVDFGTTDITYVKDLDTDYDMNKTGSDLYTLLKEWYKPGILDVEADEWTADNLDENDPDMSQVTAPYGYDDTFDGNTAVNTWRHINYAEDEITKPMVIPADLTFWTYYGQEIEYVGNANIVAPKFDFRHNTYRVFGKYEKDGSVIASYAPYELKTIDQDELGGDKVVGTGETIPFYTKVDPYYQAEKWNLTHFDVQLVNLPEAFIIVDENMETADTTGTGLVEYFRFADDPETDAEFVPESNVDDRDNTIIEIKDTTDEITGISCEYALYYHGFDEQVPVYGGLYILNSDGSQFDFPTSFDEGFKAIYAAVLPEADPDTVGRYADYNVVKFNPLHDLKSPKTVEMPVYNAETYQTPVLQYLSLKDQRRYDPEDPKSVEFAEDNDITNGVELFGENGAWKVGDDANGFAATVKADSAYDIVPSYTYKFDDESVDVDIKNAVSFATDPDTDEVLPYIVFDYTQQMTLTQPVYLTVKVELLHPWVKYGMVAGVPVKIYKTGASSGEGN
jgi:FtsZ-binding cell division protein ZapB/ABC-type phosphate transport system auxiliary subunit